MSERGQLRALFDAAVELPPEARSVYLKEACGDDFELLSECRALLSAFEALEEEPQSSLGPGDTFGPYRIVRLLGSGGMGKVYEADHIEQGRRVALKVMREAHASPNERARFLREGRLAASISHPNTVYVFATEEIAGRPVISMEFVSGGTLADRVKSAGPMPITAAVDAIREVIRGLAVARDYGVLHRDVKPSNCFVDPRGLVKVGDFGLSIPSTRREDTALTATGTMLGTPAFCAPEQLVGEALDQRADIYATGATLFYLLLGEPPFSDRNVVRLVGKVLHDPPNRPRRVRPAIPTGLETIVLRCLAKRPDDRFSTYEELDEALRDYAVPRHLPAPRLLRLLAGLLDVAALMILLQAWTGALALWPGRLPTATFVTGTSLAITWVYFLVLEGAFSGTLGKVICGLRIRSSGPTTAPFSAVAVRSLLFVTLFFVLPTIGPRIWSNRPAAPPLERGRIYPIPPVVQLGVALFDTYQFVGLALLFISARKRNGFRGVHELISNTCTTVETSVPRRDDQRSPIPTSALDIQGARLGPYVMISNEEPATPGRAYEAYDQALRRRVAVLVTSSEAPRVSPVRRDLDRATRVRWLAGQRSPALAWDAYEQPDGERFVDAIRMRVPLATVLQWLKELAREIREGDADGTLPELSIDRLWITKDHRIKLLEAVPLAVTAPRLNDVVVHLDHHGRLDHHDAQRFLHAVVSEAIGKAVAPLPRGVSRIMRQLAAAQFADMNAVLTACDNAASRPIQLSRRRRAVPIFAASLIAMVPISSQMGMLLRFGNIWGNISFYARFDGCLDTLFKIEHGIIDDPNGLKKREAQTCIAIISRRIDAYSFGRWTEDADNRRMIEESIRVPANDPSPSPADAFGTAFDPFTIDGAMPNFFMTFRSAGNYHLQATYALMAIRRLVWAGAAVSLVTAALFRFSAVLSVLGIAVVNRDGTDISRLQALTRSAAAWAPLVAATFLSFLTCPKPDPPLVPFGILQVIVAFSPFAFPLAIAACSLFDPARGWPEAASRTWLVRQ